MRNAAAAMPGTTMLREMFIILDLFDGKLLSGAATS